ncbi:MAG: hypothetical protein EHM18_04485, partial [Acidobacteria bacterium]
MTMRMLVLLLLLSVSTVHAELRKLNEDDFQTNVRTYSPGLVVGADASLAFGRYGVFLSSYPSGTPLIRGWVAPKPAPPLIEPTVTNETTGNQADSVLVVDFRSPVSKISLLLVGPPGLEVSIKAGDPAGNTLGTLAATLGKAKTFVGFGAPGNQLISKVIIDYRSAQAPEQLLALVVEKPASPQFETVLPQIAHGRSRGDLFLRTSITIVNVLNTTVTGEIRFFGPNGLPFAPELEGSASRDHIVPFTLDEGQSRLLTTSGTSGIAGYARVVSDAPIQAIAHFSLAGSADERTEIAMTSVAGQFGAVGAYNRQPLASSTEPSGVDTAFAIVNLGSERALVRLRLVDENDLVREMPFFLGPGAQMARFVDEVLEAGF